MPTLDQALARVRALESTLRGLDEELETAFRAGYHATWSVTGWSFDPIYKPGAPDKAWRAWQQHSRQMKL